MFGVPDHRERLVAKGGEGCECTEDANEKKHSDFRSEQLTRFGESGDHADRETAQEVDGQGSEGEGCERHLPVHKSTESITGESTQEATGTDNNCINQGRF